MKAFWFFSKNANDGSGDNEPSLPHGLSGEFRTVNPGDIYRLGTAAGHLHMLLGGFAIQDDNLANDDHTHLVVKCDDEFHQVTRGAASHNHPLSLDDNGEMMQDWFLCFCRCENADAVLIKNHADCFPIVEAEMTQDDDGFWIIGDLDNEAWTAGEQSTWQTRCLSILGFELPAQIDRGCRLVQMFIGGLLSRPIEEKYVRLT